MNRPRAITRTYSIPLRMPARSHRDLAAEAFGESVRIHARGVALLGRVPEACESFEEVWS